MQKRILQETYTLSNGTQIPKLGLGTWFIPDGQAAEAVRNAVELGYRLIDTAQAYENEAGIGEGVQSCGIPREEIFVTSKIAAEAKSYETAGKVKAIGVSIFLKDDLENILEGCRVKPMVNQILFHISNTNLDLIDFCKEKDILVEAYSPIAHEEALKNEEITGMAEKYGVSHAALCIRYVIQLGAIALPKTGNPVHMKENADLNFVIEDADMEILKPQADHLRQSFWQFGQDKNGNIMKLTGGGEVWH